MFWNDTWLLGVKFPLLDSAEEEFEIFFSVAVVICLTVEKVEII